jgi:hypothetical protein
LPDDGVILTDAAVACESADDAIETARAMAVLRGHVGAVAFARTGNGECGFFETVRRV